MLVNNRLFNFKNFLSWNNLWYYEWNTRACTSITVPLKLCKSRLFSSFYSCHRFSSFATIFSEDKHLLSFLFLFEVFLLCTTDCVLVFLRGILFTFGLGQDSLEGLNSLTHSGVQRSLNGMKMIVKVLPEANQESKWLLEWRCHMIREKSERYHSVWVFLLRGGVWEVQGDILWELVVVVDDSWRVLNVSLAVGKFLSETINLWLKLFDLQEGRF